MHGKNWGGHREGSGRPTEVPVGTGEKRKVTVSLGADLLDALRAARPEWQGYSDQDLLRAAAWAAAGKVPQE